METKYIIVSIVKSNNSENNVWAVAITGEEQPRGYCKTAFSAMRYSFLLKKQTGIYIDAKSLKSLSQQIAEAKARMAEAEAAKAQQGEEAQPEPESQEAVEPAQQTEAEAQPEAGQPKKQRKPRTRKSAASEAAVVALA